MEAVGTIFVVVGILIIASITLIIDWIRVQFARQDQRTHRLEDRVDGHQAVLEKHELLQNKKDLLKEDLTQIVLFQNDNRKKMFKMWNGK